MIFQNCVIFVALVVLAQTNLLNPSKSLMGPAAIWGQDRIQLQTISRKEMDAVIRMVDQYVPQDGRLALKSSLEGWDYPFFGQTMARFIDQLGSTDSDTMADTLAARNISYALIEPNERDFLTLPEGLEWVDQANGWTLYRVRSTPQAAAVPAAVRDYLLGAVDVKGLVKIDPSLVGKVGVVQVSSPHWGVEQFDGQALLWLGEKQNEGLWLYLIAAQPVEVCFSYDLRPGPARADMHRTVSFSLNNSDRLVRAETQEFTGPSTLIFKEDLSRGPTLALLTVLDPVIIHQQANGDRRALLAQLNNVRIAPCP